MAIFRWVRIVFVGLLYLILAPFFILRLYLKRRQFFLSFKQELKKLDVEKDIRNRLYHDFKKNYKIRSMIPTFDREYFLE